MEYISAASVLACESLYFTPAECTPWIRNCVGHTTVPYTMTKGKIPKSRAGSRRRTRIS